MEPVAEDDFAKPSLNDTEIIPATGAVTEVDTNVSRIVDAEEQTEVWSNQGGLLSNHSPPSDSATHGEIPVQDAKLLPEALEKFSKCPLILQLREHPQLQTSKMVPSSDCDSLGEIPMSVARSLPEALAKFSNCSPRLQLSELETIPVPGACKLNRVTAIKTRPRCFNPLWRHLAVKTLIILSILIALTVSLPSHRIKKVHTSHALECPIVETSANQDHN